MKKLSFLIIALFTGALAFAQFRPEEGFQAQAYVVRGQGIFSTWNQGEGPEISTVADGKVGDELYLMVLFKNAQRSTSGVASVKFDITLTTPSGQKVSQAGITAGEGQMPDEIQSSWYLSNARPLLRGLLTQPGEYTIDLVVKDLVAATAVPFQIKLPIAAKE